MKNKQNDNKKYSSKYISRFLNLNSAVELLPLFRSNSPTKEIQESFSFYYAFTEKIQAWTDIDFKDENVSVIVCGDGVTPRTAALFALLTKWDCISCDPLMREHDYSKFNRLTVLKCKAEELRFKDLVIKDTVILIFPHSHVLDINKIYQVYKDKKVWILNLPCCNPNQDALIRLPKYSYRDIYIDSPMNEMRIFCNYLDLKFQ